MIHIATDLPIIDYEMFHISKAQRIIHRDTRFLCLLSGRLSAETAVYPYEMSEGDILFLPSETEYQLNPQASSLLLYVCIHPYFLLDVLGQARHQIQSFYSDAQPDTKASMNARIAELITLCLNQEDPDSCGIYAKAYELLYFISQHCLLHDGAAADYSAGKGSTVTRDKALTKLRQLEQFLDRHYMESISLGDAAKALHYTPQYLSNFLKKHLNKTFQELLNTFRLDAAETLLRYSQEPAAKISFLCGFPNHSSFVKCFEKSKGITPEAYGKKSQEALSHLTPPDGILITDHSLIRDYIFNYMNYTVSAVSTHTESTLEQAAISVCASSPLPHTWNFLINMGSAKDFEKPNFRHHLTRLQTELHFQYGRCTELFTLVKIYTLNQKTSYDFSRIFRLIDFLRSLHLKPFFDIDNKPFLLYKESDQMFSDYSTYLSAERYDAFLFDMLPEFIKACILRYGFDEFSTWKFELWRRYNLNMSSLESPEDFCRRFQKVAGILKSFVPNAVLGGPGFNGFLPTEKFAELMTAFRDAPYQPDFISAYYFPYTPFSGDDSAAPSGYRASPTPQSMVERITEWKSLLLSLGYVHTPFYITEYSAHLSLENYINDSIYPAVYVFHQSIQNYGVIDGLGYWLATDISLDYGKPNSPLFGGNGLLSKNCIRKSAFYAHDFLNRLGSQLISRGAHFIVTASEDAAIQILVYHYGILKQSFADSPQNQELLHYPYSAFEDAVPLEIQLTLKQISPGAYRITEFGLDLNHGNVLSVWGQMNHLRNIGADETQYMEFKSVPSMTIHTETIQSLYTLHTTLNHNEARLFILQPC